MDSYQPDALDKLLSKNGKPTPETAEDLLELLPPQRKYLGPGAWYELVERTQKGKK